MRVVKTFSDCGFCYVKEGDNFAGTTTPQYEVIDCEEGIFISKTEADGKGFLIGPFCFGKEYIFKLSGILNKNEVSVFHAKDVIEDIILSGFEEKFF